MNNQKLAVEMAKFIINYYDLKDIDPLKAKIEKRRADLFENDNNYYLLFNNKEVFLGFDHCMRYTYPMFFMEDECEVKLPKESKDIKFINKVILSFKP